MTGPDLEPEPQPPVAGGDPVGGIAGRPAASTPDQTLDPFQWAGATATLVGEPRIAYYVDRDSWANPVGGDLPVGLRTTATYLVGYGGATFQVERTGYLSVVISGVNALLRYDGSIPGYQPSAQHHSLTAGLNTFFPDLTGHTPFGPLYSHYQPLGRIGGLPVGVILQGLLRFPYLTMQTMPWLPSHFTIYEHVDRVTQRVRLVSDPDGLGLPAEWTVSAPATDIRVTERFFRRDAQVKWGLGVDGILLAKPALGDPASLFAPLAFGVVAQLQVTGEPKWYPRRRLFRPDGSRLDGLAYETEEGSFLIRADPSLGAEYVLSTFVALSDPHLQPNLLPPLHFLGGFNLSAVPANRVGGWSLAPGQNRTLRRLGGTRHRRARHRLAARGPGRGAAPRLEAGHSGPGRDRPGQPAAGAAAAAGAGGADGPAAAAGPAPAGAA